MVELVPNGAAPPVPVATLPPQIELADPNLAVAQPNPVNLFVDPNLIGGSSSGISVAPTAKATAAPDLLVLRMSEDAFKGHAMFTVFVDGAQQDGIFTTRASHAQGETETFAFTGAYGSGPHKVGVRYLNDYAEGEGLTDRNLYVEQIEYNGATVHQGQAMKLEGDALFHF